MENGRQNVNQLMWYKTTYVEEKEGSNFPIAKSNLVRQNNYETHSNNYSYISMYPIFYEVSIDV